MFVPNKPLGSLLEISPTNHIFLKIFNSEYDKIKVWFTDQNSQPLEVEDGQKLLDSTKKSATEAIKTASKRAIQKTAEATGDLIGNKIADKIKSVSKKSSNNNNYNDENVELTTHKKRQTANY